MPRKPITSPSDIVETGKYRLDVEPDVVKQLVTIGSELGLYWTEVAKMLIHESLNERKKRAMINVPHHS